MSGGVFQTDPFSTYNCLKHKSENISASHRVLGSICLMPCACINEWQRGIMKNSQGITSDGWSWCVCVRLCVYVRERNILPMQLSLAQSGAKLSWTKLSNFRFSCYWRLVWQSNNTARRWCPTSAVFLPPTSKQVVLRQLKWISRTSFHLAIRQSHSCVWKPGTVKPHKSCSNEDQRLKHCFHWVIQFGLVCHCMLRRRKRT